MGPMSCMFAINVEERLKAIISDGKKLHCVAYHYFIEVSE